jgi:hypothetical protein
MNPDNGQSFAENGKCSIKEENSNAVCDSIGGEDLAATDDLDYKGDHEEGQYEEEIPINEDEYEDSADEEEEQGKRVDLKEADDEVKDVAILTPEEIERTDRRLALQAEKIRASVQRVVRDALCFDPYIIATQDELGLSEDQRVTRDEKGLLVFYLKEAYFDEWKARHQICLGTDFIFHSATQYTTAVWANSAQSKKDRAGQTKTRFNCQRSGGKKLNKYNVPGGVSGRRRVKRETIKCNCQSFFNAIYRPVSTSDGVPGKTYKIEYMSLHNHGMGARNDLGTQQKSQAIKDRIAAMLMRDLSVQQIMNRLTMDHARFTRFLNDPTCTRLSRDEFITYDDIYNIAYAIGNKKTRKDKDQFVSAKLWMDDLKSQGYFTYYDEEKGQFHGFSSPWQLEELRKWGDTFCFDATHNASG